MRLNRFILSICDKKVQKQCARETGTTKLQAVRSLITNLHVVLFPLTQQAACFSSLMQERKELRLGKQEAVLAVQLTNPSETKTDSRKMFFCFVLFCF